MASPYGCPNKPCNQRSLFLPALPISPILTQGDFANENNELTSMSTSLEITLHGNMLLATDASGHSVSVPCDVNGLRVLKEILRAKEFVALGAKVDGASVAKATKLGSFAKPTQAMVNAFLKSQQLEKENARKQELKEIAEMF